MRLLVDASGARGGGLGIYVASLIYAWRRSDPGTADELHILASSDFARVARKQLLEVTLHTFEYTRLKRALAQYVLLPSIIREIRPDAVLATLPVVPIGHVSPPIVAICYDLRHEFRPLEFGRIQRAARAIEYRRAYWLATKIIAISNRTGRDLIHHYPRLAAKVVVVPCGADHLPPWHPVVHPNSGPVVAYAHHPNKRPELAIQAWALMHGTVVNLPTLSILGADPVKTVRLRALCESLGLPPELVTIEGSLQTETYVSRLQNCCLVLLPSSFEGFGLPVLEALRYHVPVVVTPDPALVEVGSYHVTVASDDSPMSLASAVQRAFAINSDERRSAGALWADSFTWRTTAESVRKLVVSAIDQHGGMSSLRRVRP